MRRLSYCIIYSTSSKKIRESGEISVCKDTAENQYWMPVTLRQRCIKKRSDSVLEISGTLPEIIVCEQGSSCHPQMQVKAL